MWITGEVRKKLHLLELGGRIYKTFGIVTNIEDGADGGIFGYGKGDPMDGRKSSGGRESGAARPRRSTISSRTSSAEGTSVKEIRSQLRMVDHSRPCPEPPQPHEAPSSAGGIWKQAKASRFLLYTMVGKIVTHGRRTVLKIWTGDRGGTLFASVMKRLELLQSMPD